MIDVKKVASLARLKLSADEEASYQAQLDAIVKHFEAVSEINTEGVEPMITPTELTSFWRDDNVHHSLSTEEGLSNAPEKSGNLFKVPPVVS